MSGISPLETLSNELFTSILSHFPPQFSQPTLNSLSRTSRSLYHRTVPSLYRSWSYHGLAKNPKDLKPWRMFMETLNWRPDLAAHVKELDLREWGNCPRLEEYVGNFWEGYEEQKKVSDEREQEGKIGTLGQNGGFWVDEEGDGDYVDGEMGDEDVVEDEVEDDIQDEVTGSDEEGDEGIETGSDDDGEFDEIEEIEADELAFLGPSKPEYEEKIDAMFVKSALEIGFCEFGRAFINGYLVSRSRYPHTEGNTEIILNYAEILFETDEDKLVVKLLSLCPNLQTLWLVLPESWEPEDSKLHRFLDDTSGLATLGVLQHLGKLYICGPMHLGGNDHREYDLDMARVLPFMRLPKLSELYTLTAHRFDDPGNFPPIDYTPLHNTSSLSTLVLDEANLPCNDVFGVLETIKPNSLKRFCWHGTFRCFSTGTCIPPFHFKLGAALQKHKESLEALKLGILYLFCKVKGHHANPFATSASVRQAFGGEMVRKWEENRGPKDTILVGSFKDYPKLRTLVVEYNSLIGHQDWVASLVPLVDLLPPSLECLELISTPSWNATAELQLPNNQLFYSELVGLLEAAPHKLLKLKMVKVSHRRPDPRRESVDGDARVWSDEMKGRVYGLAEKAGFALITEFMNDGLTEVPYFMEQTKDRNPGRDF